MSRALVVLVLVLGGCASPPPPATDAGALGGDAGTGTDAAALSDAAVPSDAASRPDGGALAFGTPVALGTTPTSLPEISGIVASRTYPGTYWVENDSGNPPEIYAVDETGALEATITLSGTTNVDWEDLALAPGAGGGADVLYVADTGDNAARDSLGASGRASVRLYRLEEPDPTLGDRTLAVETIELGYPDHPHDCEAVFVEPSTGDVILISKENAAPAHVFVAHAPLALGSPLTLEEIGTLALSLATAADESRDGTRIVVRNYGEVRVYEVLPGGVAASLAASTFVTTRPGSAAEAIAFDANDRDLVTIAEGAGATLFRIPQL